jgi:hypothetical protein
MTVRLSIFVALVANRSSTNNQISMYKRTLQPNPVESKFAGVPIPSIDEGQPECSACPSVRRSEG